MASGPDVNELLLEYFDDEDEAWAAIKWADDDFEPSCCGTCGTTGTCDCSTFDPYPFPEES